MNADSDVAIDAPVISSRVWTVEKVFDVAHLRSDRADGQLVELFTVLDDLANRADREARAFVQSLAEHVPDFEPRVRELVAEAHLGSAFAGSWMLLLRGTADTLLLGDLDAAANARRLVQLLIAAHVPAGMLSGLVDDFDLDHESLLDPSGPLLIAGAESTEHEPYEPYEPRGEEVVPLDRSDEAVARAEVADWLATLD